MKSTYNNPVLIKMLKSLNKQKIHKILLNKKTNIEIINCFFCFCIDDYEIDELEYESDLDINDNYLFLWFDKLNKEAVQNLLHHEDEYIVDFVNENF